MLGRSSTQRRVVAVAPDAVELLRPASDLARILTSFGRADVLLAADTASAATRHDDDSDDSDDPDDPDADHADDDADWTRDDNDGDEVRSAVAGLGHDDLVVHRLGLAPPLRPDMLHDLVAAMSELVGFDPEPLVYCLAPADPPHGVLAHAAERIARVYGLPLLRYRGLELALVEPEDPMDPDEGATV